MKALAASESAQAAAADEQAATAMSTNLRNQRIRKELEATSKAVLVANEAYVQEGMRSVNWERRGLLQRLARASQPAAERETSDQQARER
jgi:hypothetical protein